MDEKTIAKIRPVSIKPYTGGFSFLVNTSFIFGIKITDKRLILKSFGIPLGHILLENIISFKPIKPKFVGVDFTIKGVVIKYKHGRKQKTKDELIDVIFKKKRERLLNALREVIPKKEEKQ